MQFLAGSIAHAMNAPQEAFSQTVSYIRICCGGAIFIVAYNVLGSIFRGMGNSKVPLVTVAIAAYLMCSEIFYLSRYFIWVLQAPLMLR